MNISISPSYVTSDIKCSDTVVTYHNVLYIIVRRIQSCQKTSLRSSSYARRHFCIFLYPVRLSRSAWKIHVRMISWKFQSELFRRVLQSNHDDPTTDITTTATSKFLLRNGTCVKFCAPSSDDETYMSNLANFDVKEERVQQSSCVFKSRWRTPYDGSWTWISRTVWVTMSLMFLRFWRVSVWYVYQSRRKGTKSSSIGSWTRHVDDDRVRSVVAGDMIYRKA